MGLIDKDTILELCNKSGEGVVAYYDVEKLPEIDAEIVVRCRDCKYYNTACCADGFGWCERDGNGHSATDNFFCADGEVEES